MKKIFVLLWCLLGVGTQMRSIFACEPPTPHGVIYGGCNMRCESELFVKGSNYVDYVGGFCSVGFEDSYRHVISSVQYRFCGGSAWHEVGIMESINLVPIWCYSPINLHLLVGAGGDIVVGNSWKPYASIGGEVSFGQLHSYVQLFCRYEYVYTFAGLHNGFVGIGRNYACAGLKFMLGKDW